MSLDDLVDRVEEEAKEVTEEEFRDITERVGAHSKLFQAMSKQLVEQHDRINSLEHRVSNLERQIDMMADDNQEKDEGGESCEWG